MAVSLVSAGAVVLNGTPSYGATPGAGNLLCAIWYAGGGTPQVTVTGGGWVAMASSGSSSGLNIAYKSALSSGSDATPSFSTSSAATVEFSILMEFSGLETTLLFQAFKSAIDSATSPDTETCSGVDTETPCLWLGVGRTRLSKAGTHISTLASNNVTTPNAITDNDGTSTLEHYRFAWGETNSNASATNVTQTSDSMNIAALVESLATFNMAAAAATKTLYTSHVYVQVLPQ